MSNTNRKTVPILFSLKKIKPQVWVFLGFGILVFILHALMATELQSDDIWFANRWDQEDFNLFSWLGNRYQNWSSRILIELVLVVLCRLPLPVFWVLDSLVMVAATFLIYRLFAPTRYKGLTSAMVCLLFLCLPFDIYTFVGWIAGTLNYLWPVTALLTALCAFQKISQGKKICWYELILFFIGAVFATQSEQTVVVFFAVSVAFFIWSLTQKKLHWIIVAYLVIAIGGLVLVLACPGNAARTAQETANWFPEFAEFSLLEKADLSFSVITWNFYKNLPIFALLLSSLMIYLAAEKHRRWWYRILAIFPFAFILGLQVLFEHYDFMSVFASNRYGIYPPDDLSFNRFLFYGVLLLSFCLLLLNVYLILGHNIRSIVGAGILLLGFASQAMLGFSPTVWDSGSRTGFILFCSAIALFIYLLHQWDFQSKTATRMLLLPLAAISGYTVLNELMTYSPYI